MDFHIGDRVLVDMYANGRCDEEARCVNGMIGTIVSYNGRPGIRFDQKFDGGHDLSGVCERGFGRWVDAGSLILVDEMDDVEISDDDFTMILSKESDLTPDDPFAGKYFKSGVSRSVRESGSFVRSAGLANADQQNMSSSLTAFVHFRSLMNRSLW